MMPGLLTQALCLSQQAMLEKRKEKQFEGSKLKNKDINYSGYDFPTIKKNTNQWLADSLTKKVAFNHLQVLLINAQIELQCLFATSNFYGYPLSAPQFPSIKPVYNCIVTV